MKFAVAREHREFFEKNQVIEFEELIQEEQLKELKKAIQDAVKSRFHGKRGIQLSPEQLYMAGRDLWRVSPVVKSIITHRRLAEIAAELSDQRILRLGYDQLLPGLSGQSQQSHEESYAKLLLEPHRLTEISCVQGIACGLILCLQAPESSADSEGLPLQSGSGVFVSPQALIDFPALSRLDGALYLLIVYTQATAVYVPCKADPHVHDLKEIGYVFGDKLLDKRNPIIFR